MENSAGSRSTCTFQGPCVHSSIQDHLHLSIRSSIHRLYVKVAQQPYSCWRSLLWEGHFGFTPLPLFDNGVVHDGLINLTHRILFFNAGCQWWLLSQQDALLLCTLLQETCTPTQTCSTCTMLNRDHVTM